MKLIKNEFEMTASENYPAEIERLKMIIKELIDDKRRLKVKIDELQNKYELTAVKSRHCLKVVR